MNKVILMGRLTRDPEVRYSQGENSTAIARYTLAVDRRFRRNTCVSSVVDVADDAFLLYCRMPRNAAARTTSASSIPIICLCFFFISITHAFHNYFFRLRNQITNPTIIQPTGRITVTSSPSSRICAESTTRLETS